jgi:hypothetical protein
MTITCPVRFRFRFYLVPTSEVSRFADVGMSISSHKSGLVALKA